MLEYDRINNLKYLDYRRNYVIKSLYLKLLINYLKNIQMKKHLTYSIYPYQIIKHRKNSIRELKKNNINTND